MKGFAVVLLCAFAAAQGKDTAVQSTTASGGTPAALGENPWLVHLRMAVDYSGLLRTCAGVLIDTAWVISSASCLDNHRFIWVRYGAIDVIHPSLVTETSAVTLHPQFSAFHGQNDIGIVRLNRFVHDIENVAPIALARDLAPLPATGKLCSYGVDEQGGPGDHLSCFEVLLQRHGEQYIVANSVDGMQTTDYDLGAPLVSNGVLLGIRNNWFPGLSAGVFLAPANYIDWISSVTGVQF